MSKNHIYNESLRGEALHQNKNTFSKLYEMSVINLLTNLAKVNALFQLNMNM